MCLESPYRVLLQREYIEKLIGGEDIAPTSVEIWPSSLCNYSCEWCVFRNTHSNSFLSIEKIEEILTFCQEYKVLSVLLSGGGEPTMHPNFSNILTSLESRSQKYQLYTNGSLLSRYIESFGKACEYIRISLDAGTKTTYARVHNTTNEKFSDILLALKSLKKLRPWIKIGFSYVLSQANVDDLSFFFEIAEQCADEVLLRRDVSEKNGILLINIDVVRKNYRIPIIWRKQILPENRLATLCYGSALHMLVDSSGNVPLCCRSQASLGNIFKKSLHEIWFSQDKRRFLSTINIKDCPPCHYTEVNEIIETFFRS